MHRFAFGAKCGRAGKPPTDCRLPARARAHVGEADVAQRRRRRVPARLAREELPRAVLACEDGFSRTDAASFVQYLVQIQHLIREHRQGRKLGRRKRRIRFRFADCEQLLGVRPDSRRSGSGILDRRAARSSAPRSRTVAPAARSVMKSSRAIEIVARTRACAFCGQRARRLDELRVVHRDQRLERRVRALARARCSFRASGALKMSIEAAGGARASRTCRGSGGRASRRYPACRPWYCRPAWRPLPRRLRLIGLHHGPPIFRTSRPLAASA